MHSLDSQNCSKPASLQAAQMEGTPVLP